MSNRATAERGAASAAIAPRPRVMAPQQPPPSQFPSWMALRWLFLFRLLMVVLLVAIFSPAAMDPMIAQANSQLAWYILVVYALLVLCSGLPLYLGWPRRENQVFLAVFLDIVIFTLLMHAAGGIGSGLGMLLAVAVASGALLLEGRLSLLFASLASLAVIAQQTFVLLHAAAQAPNYTQAGLLGVLFFVVALLSQILYRRVREAEALAARRKVDIDDLSKLNAYIIETFSTGVLVVDGERRVRLVNPAARQLLGIAGDPSGRTLTLISPALAHWLEEQVRAPYAVAGSIRVESRDLTPALQFLGDYRSSGVLISLRDNQELIREAQQMKLAALGTLTASIAHNIRNPLSSISHATALLLEAPELSPDDRHLLDIVQRNSARIDATVESILQISRRSPAQRLPLDLARWLAEFFVEFREAHPDEQLMFWTEQGASQAPIVEADPRHLHQVIANLCENAVVHGAALAAERGLPLELGLRLDTDGATGQAVIEVLDNGPGIDEAIANAIFDPFFTTRSRGTGLGLYIARELCEINGIELTCERRYSGGSCFRLRFPQPHPTA